MPGKYYLTTPLYYVNSKPHIGHSYTNIACDALARWHRLTGSEVLFLTGTDEHGQKIARAAEAAGMQPKEFTDKISEAFKDLWKKLNISHDDFIRTTESRHTKAVVKVWEKIKAAKVKVEGKQESVLYQNHYSGYYCVSCETFITEGLIDPNNPTLCPDCKKPLERMEEDTYFLRISAYQERLTKDIQDNKILVMPETRKNEVLGFLLNNKLKDLSISRPKSRLTWGIPLPFDQEHVTYVWFDALINYISAVGYPDGKDFNKWWPADVHVIGKDILRHHAVLWPILLYALDLSLPKMVFAHGWWVQGGQKMSKSLGNVTDPIQIVDRYGVDAFRYFLLSETPFGSDGTFSEEALISRFNTDLANDIGNLLNRSLTMCEKYFEGIVPNLPNLPEKSAVGYESRELKAQAHLLFEKVDKAMNRLAFSEAISDIWSVINKANKFIETTAPWTLAKENRTEELKYVIITLVEVLKVIAQLVWPFIPEKAEGIWAQLAISAPIHVLQRQPMSWSYSMFGIKIAKGAPLFPRIDIKKEKH